MNISAKVLQLTYFFNKDKFQVDKYLPSKQTNKKSLSREQHQVLLGKSNNKIDLKNRVLNSFFFIHSLFSLNWL